MTILSYPFAFTRVISHLAENVKGHAYPQKYEMHILISAFICESGSVFSDFKDFGVGIGKKELKKIFDPFYTTHMGRGNGGLGLSVCFNTVTYILKGRISASSGEGKGASVYIEIPQLN